MCVSKLQQCKYVWLQTDLYIFKLTKEWLKLPYGKIPVTWGCLLHMAQLHQTVTKETASNSLNQWQVGPIHSRHYKPSSFIYICFFPQVLLSQPIISAMLAEVPCSPHWNHHEPSAQHHLICTWQRNHMNNHYHGRPASALKPWNSYKQQKNINDKHRCRVHRSFPSPSQQEMWDHIKNRTDTCN